MKLIRHQQLKYQPASHENPADPGALKLILLNKSDLISGQIQMVNLAKIPPSRTFASHFHQDMQEVFIIITGRAKMKVGNQTVTLLPFDVVVVEPGEVHQMTALDKTKVTYLVFGISPSGRGQTILA